MEADLNDAGTSRDLRASAPARGPRVPVVVSLALAALAFAYFLAAMSYPWQLALLAGTAIGALAYSSFITWQRMRRLVRRTAAVDAWNGGSPGAGEDASSVAAPGRQPAPGEEPEGEREHKV